MATLTIDETIESLREREAKVVHAKQKTTEKRQKIAFTGLTDKNSKAARELERLTNEERGLTDELENVRYAIASAEEKKAEEQAKETEKEAEARRQQLLTLGEAARLLGQRDRRQARRGRLSASAAPATSPASWTAFVGGDSGRLSRWRANMSLRGKQLHEFFELPFPPTATKDQFKPFAVMDRGVMSRKGLTFNKAGNPQ